MVPVDSRSVEGETDNKLSARLLNRQKSLSGKSGKDEKSDQVSKDIKDVILAGSEASQPTNHLRKQEIVVECINSGTARNSPLTNMATRHKWLKIHKERIADLLADKTIYSGDARFKQIISCNQLFVEGASASASHLDILDISLNRVRKIDFQVPVSWASQILVLNISGNLLVELSGIECLTNLAILDASDNLINSFDMLMQCKQLQRLTIAGNRVSHMAMSMDIMIPACNFEYLDVSHNDVICLYSEGLRVISEYYTHLTHLSCCQCRLISIGALRQCTTLEILRVDGNMIVEENMSDTINVLVTLKQLKHVSLVDNPLVLSRKYRVSVLDAFLEHDIDIVTVDYAEISIEVKRHLSNLKAMVEKERLINDVSTYYLQEIAAVSKVHSNLVSKQRKEQEMVENLVKSRAARLEGDMTDFIKYVRAATSAEIEMAGHLPMKLVSDLRAKLEEVQMTESISMGESKSQGESNGEKEVAMSADSKAGTVPHSSGSSRKNSTTTKSTISTSNSRENSKIGMSNSSTIASITMHVEDSRNDANDGKA